ncbi:MerR family transcriptional regulator [Micromonospora sp. BRA006-A]|nr:MerR family transcriptional regulator [Micromonospora sp. BRA006-A]
MSLTVGEAAEQVGLTTYTLRWYEQEGLVGRVGRDSSGRRRYTESDVNWLFLLTRLRRTGCRYATCAATPSWPGTGTARSARGAVRGAPGPRAGRMAELEEDLKVLEHKIDAYRRAEEESG